MTPDDPDAWPESPEAELVTLPEEQRPMLQVDRQATALAASARASIQARVWLALERPRQLPRVRDLIRDQLKRPSLAARAVYRIERGKKKNEVTGQWEPNYIEGPSIKLANALRIAMTNLGTEDRVIADDPDYRTIEVSAIDYESNSSESRTVVVSKTVERRGSKRGGKEVPPDREIISSRKNSYGEIVYKCRSTEQEIQESQNSAASRARRNAILALVPSDIIEDAVKQAKTVCGSQLAQQRQSAIERLKSYYGKAGISQTEIADYLGRAIDDATQEDLLGLEMLATAISDGQTNWKAAVKSRNEARTDDTVDEPDAPTPGASPAKGAAAVKAAVDAATKKAKE